MSRVSCLLFVLVVVVSSTTPTTAPSSTPASCGTLFTLGACQQVTNAASFVDCNTTSKKCYCLPTFDGNASPANHCDCLPPKQVYFPSSPLGGGILSGSIWTPANWGFDTPICINLAQLQALKAQDEREARQRAKVFTFFNNTIYPTPFAILASGGTLLHSLMTPTVKSRISPAGSFNGFEGVMEYFYGFVANPGFFVSSIDIRSIASTNNTVAAKVNIFCNNPSYALTGGVPPQFFNLSIFAFVTFNSDELITSIDVSVPNLGILLDSPIDAVREGNIQFTCQILTMPSPFSTNPGGTCGALGTFAGATPAAQFADCLNAMHSVPFGSRNRINANNFVCRDLHTLLTPYNPVVHCPHASRSGGDACIDFTYESFFQTEY